MYWHNSDAGCGSSVSSKTQEGRLVMVVSTVLVASRIKARHTALAVLSHDDEQQAMCLFQFLFSVSTSMSKAPEYGKAQVLYNQKAVMIHQFSLL